jgi:hypothetical protein
MSVRTAGLFLLVAFAVLWTAVPLASGGAVNNTWAAYTGTGLEPNFTGGVFANRTIPAEYAIPPTPIRIEIRLSETSLPATKGEMAVGPRSIGFSFEPGTLAILILVVVASAGMWYLVRRRPVEEDEEE